LDDLAVKREIQAVAFDLGAHTQTDRHVDEPQNDQRDAGGAAAGGAAAGVCARAPSMAAKVAKAVNRIPKTKTVGAKREGFVQHLPAEVTASQSDGVNFISFPC